MSPDDMDDDFTKLIGRVRCGDATAAEELFREYEPAIRLEVRMALRFHSQNLRRRFDSEDVCQSVLVSFFLRLAVGQFELERPEQLLALLKQMARNKLTDQVKHQYRARRDLRITEPMEAGEDVCPSAAAEPVRAAAANEILSEVRVRLNGDERRVMELRAERRSWQEVAVELGGTPEARRKQFHRAINRVAHDLGLPTFGPTSSEDPE